MTLTTGTRAASIASKIVEMNLKISLGGLFLGVTTFVLVFAIFARLNTNRLEIDRLRELGVTVGCSSTSNSLLGNSSLGAPTDLIIPSRCNYSEEEAKEVVNLVSGLNGISVINLDSGWDNTFLSRFTELTELAIKSKGEIHCLPFRKSSKLKVLSLNGSGFRELETLSFLPKLEFLSIACHPPHKQVGSIDLSVLESVSNLKWLLIKDCVNIENIGKSHSVSTLIISNCAINETSFLLNFPNLTYCEVRMAGNTPVSAGIFSKLNMLTEVRASNLYDLDKLSSQKNLKRLQISDTQLSKGDVRSLVSITGLHSLKLLNVDIQPQLLDELTSRIPQVDTWEE